MIKRFMQLFKGLDRAYGQFTITGTQENNKKKGIARVVREKVTPVLWDNHLTGKMGLGIIPINDDAKVHWGAIDIDINTINHKLLEKQVIKLKLPLIVCRSKSGGAHLYLFCSEPISAKMIRSVLDEWAAALGHPGVEVFPKQNTLANKTDIGNWINMPYFSGEKTTRYAIIDGKAITDVEAFLDAAFAQRVDEETIRNTKIEHLAGFEEAPPCLQALTREGIPEGNRNKALFNFGVLMRLKNDDNWEQELDAINQEFFNPPLPAREVTTIQKSLNKSKYYYTCSDSPICERCNKTICRQRKYGIGSSDGSPNITMGTLIRVAADPCYWIMDVDGFRLELSTDDLMEQRKFRKKCVEAISKLPKKMKGDAWDMIIDAKLKNIEHQDAPPDAGPIGQLRFHINNFCMSRLNGNVKADLLRGKPWFDETNERAYFRSADLIDYLRRHNFYEFKNSKDIWQAMNSMGAGHSQFNIKGSNVQVWHIRLDPVQVEEFEVPSNNELEEF